MEDMFGVAIILILTTLAENSSQTSNVEVSPMKYDGFRSASTFALSLWNHQTSNVRSLSQFSLVPPHLIPTANVILVASESTASLSQCSGHCSSRGNGCNGFFYETSSPCGSNVLTRNGICKTVALLNESSNPLSLEVTGCQLFYASSLYRTTIVAGELC